MAMIQLLNGINVDSDAITFDKETYQFYLGGSNITNEIKRVDKRRFPGFDDTTENLRVYNLAHPDAPATGPTSIWGNFYEQITTDPLDAPVEMLERGIKGAGDALLNTTTGKVAIVLVVVGVLAVLYANRPR